MILYVSIPFTIVIASIITIMSILVSISMLTSVKIPLVDQSMSVLLSRYYIKLTRKKNNLVYVGWNLTHYDMDEQDIRWERHIGGQLEAKLRIVYNISKETFIAFHSRWNDKRDVMLEVEVHGEPQYLMNLFGIPKRVYEIIQPGCPCHTKITGGANYPIISVATKFRFEK